MNNLRKSNLFYIILFTLFSNCMAMNIVKNTANTVYDFVLAPPKNDAFGTDSQMSLTITAPLFAFFKYHLS